MLSFFFGKPKPEPVPTGPSESTLATLKVLAGKESDLDKRITMLVKQIETLTTEAVTAHKAGQKAKALLIMKKKATLEEQIKTNISMIMKIFEQKASLESTIINSDTLNAIRQANVAMKAEQSTWNVDKVKDLLDDLDDVRTAHREINDLLQEPSGIGPSEEDLLEELDALTVAPLEPLPPAPLPVLPEVPTTAIEVTKKPESEMEHELERLVVLASGE
jgi:charged multivesicular body protein 4